MGARAYKTHKWMAKVFLSKWCKLTVDSTLLIASGYLMLKKFMDVSMSGWLLNNAFHQPLVNVYVVTCTVLLVSALVVKIVIMFLEAFPPKSFSSVELDEVSDCLLMINNEICQHIDKCNDENKNNIQDLNEQHRFKVNLAAIADALAEHIANQFERVSKKDIFISVYSYDETAEELNYLFHADPKKDWVVSKKIRMSDHKYNSYECAKCLKSDSSTAYVLKKSDYAKGEAKRFKSFEHYLGCKLFSGNLVFGFVNIEIHNYSVFADEDQMHDFMQNSIMTFKILMEYQFLKQRLFHSFKNFDKHWRAA